MIYALGLALLMGAAGYAVLRGLGLAKGAAVAGLAPVAGLAATVILAAWIGFAGLPAPIAGVLVLALGLAGFVWLILDRATLIAAGRGLLREHRLAVVLLGAALWLPILVMGLAFAGVEAPLSPHDGAFHVETSDAFRHAAAALTWYPPGVAALFGALLQLTPWLDSALGVFNLALGLTLLAPIVAFGLGMAVLRNLVAASAGALFVSMTHLLAYYPQVWGGWPQLLGILLVVGLWTLAIGYVEEPSARRAALAGLIVGAIVLVHGTELYTSAIVLAVLAIAHWRRLQWARLGLHLLVAIGVALVASAPYIPALLHWAGAGGAYAVGYEDGSALVTGDSTMRAAELLGLLSADALGVDFPIRAVLVVAGTVWLVRRSTGRTLVAVALVFFGLAVAASLFQSVPLVRQVYAATYPWSLPFRHLTFASLPLALVAGAGWVAVSSRWGRWIAGVRGVNLQRRLARAGRLLVIAWLLVAAWALTFFVAISPPTKSSYSARDDGPAMAWLRSQLRDGDVVANDTFADAGIWAPYKAGATILLYRSRSDVATAAARNMVISNIASLGEDPAVTAAACELGVRWVYYGAQASDWQRRAFPSLAELKASPGLEEAFSSGDATVFRTKCP